MTIEMFYFDGYSYYLIFQVDTYSFGVILFDLITGKPPNSRPSRGQPYLIDLLKSEDVNIWNFVDPVIPIDVENSHNIVKVDFR